MIRYIFDQSASVVVFRSSPKEKAEVIKFVQEDKSIFTLAIGDGGNDVNMIQTAGIGIGIMGKEGNQAAQFSDYAIPNFKGLRRLVFWYGHNFGTKAVTFLIPMNLFKGLIFSTPTFFANMHNGFSGIPIYDDFYYSLFSVLMTTISCTTYIWVDQVVDMDYEKYKKSVKPVEKNSSYDPVKGQAFSIDAIFGREEWIKKNGISTNEDGSTNNITAFYHYCRDSWIKSMNFQFVFYTIWGFVVGAMMYYFSFGLMDGPISAAGQTNDYWNSGIVLLFVQVLYHHLLCLSESRQWNSFLLFFYALSFSMFFLVMNMNDNFGKSVYQENQWSMLMSSPLTYLHVLF
jgi:magnesium-transporting ATPase (P-type)